MYISYSYSSYLINRISFIGITIAKPKKKSLFKGKGDADVSLKYLQEIVLGDAIILNVLDDNECKTYRYVIPLLISYPRNRFCTL